MPKNTSRLGKNGMKITTISALIYESKLALCVPATKYDFYIKSILFAGAVLCGSSLDEVSLEIEEKVTLIFI